MFLDEAGEKISKSRGNGISVEDWLRFAPSESLAQYMFNQPTRAKRLHFDVIPRAVDEYVANLERARDTSEAEVKANPVWFIHGGSIPADRDSPLGFGMLLNLASVANAETSDVLWGFIERYSPGTTPANNPFLARLAEHAVAYYRDFVRPAKTYRAPNPVEREALADLAGMMRALPPDAPAEDVQNEVFAVGKRHAIAPLRAWFGCLYEVLLGQSEGPRFGIFASLYGLERTAALIDAALLRHQA
jgi:lysyl-tRNA synthetase class 1